MSVRKNLTITIAVAVHKAKRDNKNYNIILIDPNEKGQFDLGSRYEIVDDTIYHTQIKPNIVLVHTTNELIRKQNDDQTKQH